MCSSYYLHFRDLRGQVRPARHPAAGWEVVVSQAENQVRMRLTHNGRAQRRACVRMVQASENPQ